MSLDLAGSLRAQPRRRLAGFPASPPDYLFSAGLWVLGGILVSFVGLPILRIYIGLNLRQVLDVAFGEGVLPSIGLSVEAAMLSAAVALVLGVPLAYRLSHDSFRGKGLVEMVVDLPLAVPHSVAGIALLFVFGRQGVLGAPLGSLGVQFWGSLAGIVVGMLFVSCPFMVNTARVAFDGIDRELEQIAQTEGASAAKIFWAVGVPLAFRGIFTGAVLSYARSLSEFGAVVILAYYPMTAPVKIYDLFLQGGLGASTSGAALLLLAALGSFVVLRFLSQRSER